MKAPERSYIQAEDSLSSLHSLAIVSSAWTFILIVAVLPSIFSLNTFLDGRILNTFLDGMIDYQCASPTTGTPGPREDLNHVMITRQSRETNGSS